MTAAMHNINAVLADSWFTNKESIKMERIAYHRHRNEVIERAMS